MEKVLGHPAEPVVEDGSSTHGGFAEIARRLNALHPERSRPISRQLVHRWFECQGYNLFPAPQPVEINGKPRSLFDLASVERWYVKRERERVEAGKPPIETIPLFQVDRRGHPIDSEQGSYRGHPAMRENYRSSILDL